MCRAPLGNGVPPMGFSLDEINWGMAEAAFLGYLDIVCLMLSHGANNYNTGLTSAASGGHIEIVLPMLQQMLIILMKQWPEQLIEVMKILFV